jgi:predicted nucleic acid-binding Zn ribbon protein
MLEFFDSMRSLAHIVPAALVRLLASMPTSQGKVDFAWSAAVGKPVGRVTRVKLAAGVLVVETTSAHWTREITRAAPMILSRLQTYLGPDTVSGIDVRTNTSLRNANGSSRAV